MRIEIDIEKRHFFVLLVGILLVGGVLVVLAYREPPQWSNFQPSKMGHSVDEIDWGQSIKKTVNLGGEVNEPTLNLVSDYPIIRMEDISPLSIFLIKLDSETLKITSINNIGGDKDDLVLKKDVGSDDVKVGVGTNNPQNKLHVNGDIRFGHNIGIIFDYKTGNGVSCPIISTIPSRTLIPIFKRYIQLNANTYTGVPICCGYPSIGWNLAKYCGNAVSLAECQWDEVICAG